MGDETDDTAIGRAGRVFAAETRMMRRPLGKAMYPAWCGAVVVVLSLVALGCGGSSEPTSVQAGSDVDTADTDASGDEPSETTTVTPDASSDQDNAETDGEQGSDEPETLAEYLGVPWLSLDFSSQQEAYGRQEQQVQELIAACMAQQGFEYIPAVHPDTAELFGNPWDTEFASTHGFGITTAFGEALTAVEDDEWIDPNQAIVEALSESERRAYHDVLHGYSPEFGLSSPSSASDAESGSATADTTDGDGVVAAEPVVSPYDRDDSCSGQAYEQVYSFERFDELYDQLDLESMYERMEADPRTKAFAAEWSACMRERGYEYDDLDDLYNSVYTDFGDRLHDITGSSGSIFGDLGELSSEEFDELFADKSAEEIEDYYAKAEQETLANVDQEALGALQEEERSLAVANAECSSGMLDFYQELSREYEARFIEENRAVLEQFRADSAS